MKKIFILACTAMLAGCSIFKDRSVNDKEKMVASWYMHGTRTASGERFNPDGLTAAHKTLPFGTKLRLTYRDKTIIVRINDRGPFSKGRQLDLSRGAAKAIGCFERGVCLLEVERLSK
jgi:rare lipoprotein A